MMRKLLAVLLALITALSIFTACGEDKKSEVNGENGTTSVDDRERVFESPEIEAIVVVAEAYLARRAYLQYDQSRMIGGNATPVTYRRDIHKNAPEDATRQFNCYTTCSGFTSDVYYQAFGFSYNADTTGALMGAVDMQAFSYEVTGDETAEEMKKVKQDFLAELKAGDIICCRHDASSGHAMLYIGDGKLIHSSAPDGGSFNYASNADRIEPGGSVASKTLDSIWSEGDDYYFFDEYWWGIIRPLIKYPDAEITEQTQYRIANMQGITAEKLSSHPVGFTADLGDEITYTFSIKNTRKTEAVLEIEDTVPEHTSYVSSDTECVADGNSLKWNITIPPSSTLMVSYSVKVDSDPALYGEYVYSESTVGGVNTNCRKVYIGKRLNTTQQNSIFALAENIGSYSETGLDLVNTIYADIGADITLDSVEEIINGSFKDYVRNGKTYSTHYELDENSKYFKMIVPTMYGGYYTATSDHYDKLRTRGIQPIQLMAGDILICSEGAKVVCFMYAGENRVLTLQDTPELLTLPESRDVLLSAMGYDRFVVIRPIMRVP